MKSELEHEAERNREFYSCGDVDEVFKNFDENGKRIKSDTKGGHMSQHTPGPWVVNGHRVDAEAFIEETTLTYRDGHTEPYVKGLIALVYDPRDNSTPEANQHLIAAAPELLEALNDVLACLHAWKYDLEKYREYAHLLKYVADAIDKAEGRS